MLLTKAVNLLNTENIENNSAYFKLLECNPSQLTFLMTSGYHAKDYNLTFYFEKRDEEIVY